MRLKNSVLSNTTKEIQVDTPRGDIYSPYAPIIGTGSLIGLGIIVGSIYLGIKKLMKYKN